MRYFILAVSLLLSPAVFGEEAVRVGSKKFTEQYLLSEILAQLIESQTELKVERRFGLGGTVVCFEALKSGEIDLYPEYSGTVQEEILGGRGSLEWGEVLKILREEFGLEWLESFGFNNTYALAVPRSLAEKRRLSRISDLKDHPDLHFGLSHEFLSRKDGWPAVRSVYSLEPDKVSGLDHGLAYESIAAGKVDVIDSYSTDAKIPKFDLLLLKDDREFFPKYLAAPLVRTDLLVRHPELKPLLNRLAGRITDAEMQALNAQVELEGKSFADAARSFLAHEGLATGGETRKGRGLTVLIGEHLYLTFVSTGLAILVGIPLGIALSRRRKLAQVLIGIAGVAQTIPGIALLVFMIPFFGIGTVPAIAALFLYGLLPILRNTVTGIREISPVLLEAADGIGLTKRERLRHVEIPLATRVILAGIRTSAVINIGTATLAAFIGAGGLGEPIVTGLALNNTRIVLSGAIPAACLAILTELLFEGIEFWVTPRGLKIS